MEPCPYCGNPVSPTMTHCPACGSELIHLSQNLPQGTRLKGGQYSLGKMLGQGGFGITYLGADTRLNQPVAIKELFPEGSSRQVSRVIPPTSLVGTGFSETLQRFGDEARTLAQFNHPGIVRVFDVFEENGTAYLVMEFLKGQTLGKRIEKEGKLNPAEVQTIANKLSDALETVHGAGLLHRDIKPDNIFLTDDGRVVLIDFGSARQFAFGQTVSHTRLVTPGYAPLEQYGTSGKFGPYTDIYALGATLYHALTGTLPPAATDRIQNNAPLRLPTSMPDGLENAVNKALEIRIDQRPQTIAEFRNLLNQGKAPPPALGSLELTVNPKDASVRLKGPNSIDRSFKGNQSLAGLPAGTYTLEVDAAGYEPQTLQVQVRANNRAQAQVVLKVIPAPAPTPIPNPTPSPIPSPQPQPTPKPRFPFLSDSWVFVLCILGAAAAFIFILVGIEPTGLTNFLQPLDEALKQQYTALAPDYPELLPGIRAALYTLGFLGVFILIAFLNGRLYWLLPAVVLPVLVWWVLNGTLYLWEAGVLALGLVGIYLFFDLLKRYPLPVALLLGALAGLYWANPSLGESFSLGGIAVALLLICLGGIVRLIRGRV